MRSIAEARDGEEGQRSESEYLEFARKIALDLLTARARSEAELREKLAGKAVPVPIIDQLCGRFREVGLLDDVKFAEAVVSSRANVSLRGRHRIREELRRKGVDAEIVAEALDQLDEDAERAAARELAKKKRRSLQGLEFRVAQRRLAGALARRGFAPGIVMDVTRETLQEWTDGDVTN